jgi:hypothetical protein
MNKQNTPGPREEKISSARSGNYRAPRGPVESHRDFPRAARNRGDSSEPDDDPTTTNHGRRYARGRNERADAKLTRR